MTLAGARRASSRLRCPGSPAHTPRVARRTRPALGDCPRVGAAPTAQRGPARGSGTRTEAAVGFRRPAAGHAGAPAAWPAARGARRVVRVDRSTVSNAVREVPALLAAGWLRRARQPRRPAPHAGGRVRLRMPRASACGSTALRSRIAARKRAARAAGRRLRCAPRASPSSSTSTRSQGQKSMRATADWPTSFPTRSTPRRRSRRTTNRWASTTPGASGVATSPRPGSTSSTPRPSTSSGGRRNGSPDDARPTPKTHLTIAGLVSDRSAKRATRRRTTELVVARPAAC